MASRRMFSQKIVSSGRFLMMSPSAQALYFHLAMNADDDGVVEAHMVMKMTDGKPDDFKVLIAKNFIFPLNDDLVVVVLDWREHNLIRADRKVDSIYKELLAEKLPNVKLLQPAARADTGKETGRPVDNQLSAQDRIGKDTILSESSDSEEEFIPVDEDGNPLQRNKNKNTPEMRAVYAIFADNPASKKWHLMEIQREATKELLSTMSLEDIRHNYELAKKHRSEQMCPKIYSPLDMLNKSKQMEDYFKSL